MERMGGKCMTPHPCRCETCSRTDCEVTVYNESDDGRYTKIPITFNPKDPCESTLWFVQGIALVGCLSHPQAREYLMADVIAELQHLADNGYKDSMGYAVSDAYKLAIVIIKGGNIDQRGRP